MEISLTCGLIRTVLVAWLCLYKVPARLRAIKKAEEPLVEANKVFAFLTAASGLPDVNTQFHLTWGTPQRYRSPLCATLAPLLRSHRAPGLLPWEDARLLMYKAREGSRSCPTLPSRAGYPLP